MIQITLDGEELVTVNNPIYIKKHENGSYVICDESEATGVSVASTPYHIYGKPALDELPDVILSTIDESTYQVSLNNKFLEVQADIVETVVDEYNALVEEE